MAKLNKRRSKKLAKKQSQQPRKQSVKSRRNQLEKQIRLVGGTPQKSVLISQLEKQYTSIISRKKKYEKAKDLLDWKRESLRALGFEETQLKTSYLRKIKKDDIESYKRGNYDALSIDKYPFLYVSKSFDFDRVYPIPDGMKLHFAFRALNGETDISDEINRFKNESIQSLLASLETIKNMPLTGTKNKKGSKGSNVNSSGKAGEGRIEMFGQGSLQEIYNQYRNDDRRSNTFAKKLSKRALEKGIGFQHSGIDYHWQVISQIDGQGNAKAYTEISARKLLIIANAIMWNIREDTRQSFYNEWKYASIRIIPELKNILP